MKKTIVILFSLLFSSALFNVLAQNNQPVANAGADKTVNECSAFFLTGKGTDSDHDPLTFKWIVPEELSLYVSVTNASKLTISPIHVNADKT